MDWPRTPVEQIPPNAFRPPFCPKPACDHHRAGRGSFRRVGTFVRKCDGRIVPRFECRHCGGGFSQQTFATTYFLKRPELLPHIAKATVAGSANRQIARSLGCAHTTVALQQARLGRHGLLLLQRCLQRLPTVDEAIVYDHFESFVFSQDHAFGMGTPVGRRSWFVYALDDAPHRIGRRRRRRGVGKEHRRPGSYLRSFRHTLEILLARADPARPVRLITDAHPAYRSTLRKHFDRRWIDHRVFPNPPRWLSRTAMAARRHRAMFAVDLTHKLLRHTLSHHRRETIAFSRRLNAAMERGVPVRDVAQPGQGAQRAQAGCEDAGHAAGTDRPALDLADRAGPEAVRDADGATSPLGAGLPPRARHRGGGP